MKSVLPSFGKLSRELDVLSPVGGLQRLSDGTYCWNYNFASEAHAIPGGFTVLTLREFVSVRVRSIESMLDNAQVSLRSTKACTILDIIYKHRKKLIPLIPDIWQDRFHTATVMYRNLKGGIDYIDIPDRFVRPGVDYTRISDGGGSVDVPISETPYSRLTWGEYLCERGGQHSIGSLEKHALVRAKIPDDTLRKKYLSALGIVGALFRQYKHSIWAPREMKRNHLRWEHAGIGEVFMYPANCTTQTGRVILRKN